MFDTEELNNIRSFQTSNVNVSRFSPEFGYHNYNPDTSQIKVFLKQFHNRENHAEQEITAAHH